MAEAVLPEFSGWEAKVSAQQWKEHRPSRRCGSEHRGKWGEILQRSISQHAPV